MTEAQEIELQKRIARLIDDRLAVTETQYTPMFRLIAAYAAAREIVERAKTNGTSLQSIEAKLGQLESKDYQI